MVKVNDIKEVGKKEKLKWSNVNDAWKLFKEDALKMLMLEYIWTCINKDDLSWSGPSVWKVVRLFILCWIHISVLQPRNPLELNSGKFFMGAAPYHIQKAVTVADGLILWFLPSFHSLLQCFLDLRYRGCIFFSCCKHLQSTFPEKLKCIMYNLWCSLGYAIEHWSLFPHLNCRQSFVNLFIFYHIFPPFMCTIHCLI